MRKSAEGEQASIHAKKRVALHDLEAVLAVACDDIDQNDVVADRGMARRHDLIVTGRWPGTGRTDRHGGDDSGRGMLHSVVLSMRGSTIDRAHAGEGPVAHAACGGDGRTGSW